VKRAIADLTDFVARCYERHRNTDVTKSHERESQIYVRLFDRVRKCRAIVEALPADYTDEQAEAALDRISELGELGNG
jgi:hypothetical protein